jgi:hypothetical protein
MAKPPQREPWELRAEDLVRDVRDLLDSHRAQIEKALRKSLGRDEAQARLDMLGKLVEALELELWRVAIPDRRLGQVIARGIKGGLGKILTATTITTTTLLTTDAYHAVVDTQAKADEVIVCVTHDEERKEQIARLLAENAIRNQAELLDLLAAEGVTSNLAEISRDFDELGVLKVRVQGGGTVYAVPQEPAPQGLVSGFSEPSPR